MSPAANSKISLASLTPHNLGTLRKLNSVLFPISYTDRYYTDVLKPEVEDFCKLVYYNDIPVGSICCRIENKDDNTRLYLMTMGVLAVYRGRGLGSQSLQQVIDAARSHTKPKLDKIYLHVQTSNAEAREFYEKHGFGQVGVHENYYKKLVPRDAWIMELTLEK